MNTERLTQSDFDDLSAYLDGELAGPRAQQVRQLLATDATWQQAHRHLVELNGALDAFAAPALPAGLADRIIAKAHETARPRTVIRLVRWLAPAAAAAAILVAVLVLQQHKGPQGTQADRQVAQTDTHTTPTGTDPLHGVATEDRFVVENLDFFCNYDVAANLETLEAIDHAQNATPSTPGT